MKTQHCQAKQSEYRRERKGKRRGEDHLGTNSTHSCVVPDVAASLFPALSLPSLHLLCVCPSFQVADELVKYTSTPRPKQKHGEEKVETRKPHRERSSAVNPTECLCSDRILRALLVLHHIIVACHYCHSSCSCCCLFFLQSYDEKNIRRRVYDGTEEEEEEEQEPGRERMGGWGRSQKQELYLFQSTLSFAFLHLTVVLAMLVHFTSERLSGLPRSSVKAGGGEL